MVMSSRVNLFILNRHGEMIGARVFHHITFNLVEFAFGKGDPVTDVLVYIIDFWSHKVVSPLCGCASYSLLRHRRLDWSRRVKRGRLVEVQVARVVTRNVETVISRRRGLEPAP